MNRKLKVAVVFGGQSGEHEVSLMSVSSVLRALNKEKYEIIMIGITRQGAWKHYDGPIEEIITGEWEKSSKNLDESAYCFLNTGRGIPNSSIDIVFPVLHGPMGEDGTIQGLFELAGLAYVGCGVLASAVGMDKVFSKLIFNKEGLRQADYLVFMKQDSDREGADIIPAIEKKFDYPVFIKPANLGSSVGITKAHNRDALLHGLKLAWKYDSKLIVEEFIEGHEVECSVLGNENPRASVVGEILPSNELYDYEPKYFNCGKSDLIIPAAISKKAAAEVQRMALRAFKAIEGSGLARVDFFVHRETDDVYINEINTMPGFTKISMYPKLWDATGLPYSVLLDNLIDLGIKRHSQRINTALI